MSVNWVMLSPSTNPPYAPLPREQTVFTSPPRISISISTPSHFPGKKQEPYSLTNSTGLLYLTNQRVIYLPDKSTDNLQSFSAPILSLHDSHVTAPFFGPNAWMALLQPTHGGGIPVPPTGVVELKFTFKDGGAFDFHSNYEQIRERLQQALEVQRMNGDGGASDAGRIAMQNVDTSNINLDDLPAYQEESTGPLINPAMPPQQSPQPTVSAAVQRQQQQRDAAGAEVRPTPRATDNVFSPPNEPPPDYEEAQVSGVQDELERRLENASR